MTSSVDRGGFLKTAGAALAASTALAGRAAASEQRSFLVPHPRWRFVFVNHATTNPFFVPTLYGIGDACSLYGVTYEWVGSERSDVGEMVAAMRRAIRERAHGIAVSIIDPTAFNKPTAEALDHHVPVVAYNADGGVGNNRLAYVGQDLYQSGLKFGSRIAELVGDGDVFLFIATPGQLNIQPRIDGALDAIHDSGKRIHAHVVATGPDVRAEREKIDATYRENKRLRGMFAVDGGSTQGVAEVMRRYRLDRNGVRAGGYDLLPGTLRAVAAGHLDFTIDQQPYLQGYVPVQQLFFFRYSGRLVSPADTNTGLAFVERKDAQRYLGTRTRYEGSSSVEKYPIS